MLNIQEIHDLVFWGAGGIGFSVSSEHTQTYVGQVRGHRGEQSKGEQPFTLWSCFRSSSPLLHNTSWLCSGKFHVSFTSLPPPSLNSESDCKPVGISCFLTRIIHFGSMAFIHLFTHSLTHPPTMAKIIPTTVAVGQAPEYF